MRIIGGTLRSRRLDAPPGLATRPTSDRLRETLFNVLAPRMMGARFPGEGVRFLDLFAGSGAVGIEALSRGAAHVVFVERSTAALAVLRRNLANLGISAGISVYSGSVEPILRRLPSDAPFDLVFLDPPYDAAEAYNGTLSLFGGSLASLFAPDALVIAEHRKKEKLKDRYGILARTRLLEQGDAALSFYASAPLSADAPITSSEPQ